MFFPTLLSYIRSLRLISHVIAFYTSSQKELLVYERDQWLSTHHLKQRGLRGFLLLLNTFPEYRTLFYFRTGKWWLSFFAKGQNNLEFYLPSDKVGKGLIIWHGFSTVINARSIGENCQIWHNVTIGKKTSSQVDDRPSLGDGVLVCAGAIVIGAIKIADHTTIGAGAIVIKDITGSGMLAVNQSAQYVENKKKTTSHCSSSVHR